MRRPAVLGGLLAASFLTLLPIAHAVWSITGSGLGTVKATTVNAGHAPSVGVAGDTVRLVWKPTSLSSSAPVAGYLVKRYDSTGLVEQVVAAGSCAQTVEATSCSETSVPDGTWRYSVTPVHNGWRGAESPRSVARVAATPSTTISFPAVGAAYSAEKFTEGCDASRGDVCGTVLDAGSGVTAVRVSLQQGDGSYWNGTGFTSAGEVLLDATGTTSWSYPFDPTALAVDGPYTLRVEAVDGTGVVGVASSTFTTDLTPPVAPTIESAPTSSSSSTAASFGFSNPEAGIGFECRLDGSAWAACTSPRSYSGLAQGSHTFEVRSVDAAGNISPVTTHTWMVDTVAPSAAITFPTSGASYHNSGFTAGCATAVTGDLCGTASDTGSGVARVQISLQRGTGSYWNGTGFTSGTEVLLDATGTTSWSYAFAATAFPADGQYTLRTRATDAAGNTTITATTFTIDRTPPVTTIAAAPADPSSSAVASFGFSSNEAGVGFECRLDGSAWAACTSPRAYSGLAEGSHTFEVRSVDVAGNVGNATSHTWVIDTVAPAAAVTFPTNGSSYNNAGFTAGCGTAATGDLCGTASDSGTGVAQVEISLRQGSGSFWRGTDFSSVPERWFTASGTTSWSYGFTAASFPAEGQYTLRARATDAAGNTTITSTTFTIDRTPPTAVDIQAANGGGAPRVVDQGDTVTFTFSETMSTTSILSGWNGSSTGVVVHLNDGGAGNDTLTIWNASNTQQLPLGTINLGRTDYTDRNPTFGTAGTPSTMAQNTVAITVTLGARGSGPTPPTAGGAGTMTWTPSTTATDGAGNPAAATARTESGAADSDF